MLKRLEGGPPHVFGGRTLALITSGHATMVRKRPWASLGIDPVPWAPLSHPGFGGNPPCPQSHVIMYDLPDAAVCNI